MKVTNYIASAALAATLGLWGASADALKLTFGPLGTSTNGTPIPVSGEAVFSFASDTTFADGTASGGDLRIDVNVTNTTSTSTSITQSFLVGFGFDILGDFKGAEVGSKLDNVNMNASFPGNVTVDLGACTATSCTGGGQPVGIEDNGGSDSFSVYTLGGTTVANAEQDYFKLFTDGQPFATGSNSNPTSVMRWRGIEGNDAAGGSETKINPTVVPLPAAAWLMITVFGGLGVAARYKKKLSAA